jgi:hypothetical protein
VEISTGLAELIALRCIATIWRQLAMVILPSWSF